MYACFSSSLINHSFSIFTWYRATLPKALTSPPPIFFSQGPTIRFPHDATVQSPSSPSPLHALSRRGLLAAARAFPPRPPFLPLPPQFPTPRISPPCPADFAARTFLPADFTDATATLPPSDLAAATLPSPPALPAAATCFVAACPPSRRDHAVAAWP
ncbi:unnamed protein product [Closterium sp. NIES-54]